jgi:sugar phosphate isomerase/epimerase
MIMLQLFYEEAPAVDIDRRLPLWPELTLAVSATWRHNASRLDWIAANGLACAFTPNPERLDLISQQLIPYIDNGMAVRHHGYFPGEEIGHAHAATAEGAMQLHFKAMEALQGVGEPLMTIHVGLNPTLPLNHRRVVENLTRLVAYGKKICVAISLENLRRGPTANLQTLLDWARRSGAGITLDVGHAVSSRCVGNKTISVKRIIHLVAERLMEVHFYELETDRHWAPQNMDILGPVVDELITTGCRWWTIELEDIQDVLLTRKLLIDHFDKTQKALFCRPETEAVCALPA